MVRYVFLWPFVAPNQKMPIESTVTVQKLPEIRHKDQSREVHRN